MSRMVSCAAGLLLGAAGIGTTVEVGWAQAPTSASGAVAEAVLKADIENLLRTGWPRTRTAREAAAVEYSRLRAKAPGDIRITYAYALIQLQQLKHRDAQRLLDEVVAADKDHRAAWMLKVWLSALQKQYDRVADESMQLAQLVGDKRKVDRHKDNTVDQPEPPGTQPADVAALLGRIYGYAEATSSPAEFNAALSGAQRQMAAELGETLWTTFEDARKTVLDDFAASGDDIDQATATAEAAAQLRKEQLLKQAEQQAVDAERQVATAEENRQKVEEEVSSVISELDKHYQQLAVEMRHVEADTIDTRRKARHADTQMLTLLDLVDGEEDPVRRHRLRNEAAHWRIVRDTHLEVLADRERQMVNLRGKAGGIERQRQQLQAVYQREVQNVQTARNTLQRVQRQKDRVQAERVTGNSPQVREQKRRSAALSTYAPLPVSLQAEARRLRDSFD